MKKKKENWLQSLLIYAGSYKKRFGLSILLSVLSITAGLIPFFCMYQVICSFVSQKAEIGTVLFWCAAALLMYLLKIVCFAASTGVSHQIAYHVVEGLRLKLAERFLHAPLGEVQAHAIGEIKNVIVDKIEDIEPPLAHVVPEGTGHIVLPLISILALWSIDFRLALASLVTFPAAMLCMALTFKISGKNYDTYNAANAYMNSTIVEYIEGIEVIKAFGRAGVSYEKYAKAITNYKTFVLKWFSSTWITMKLAFALFPSTLVGTLPVSLPEPEHYAALDGTDVELLDVHFSYDGSRENEVLHGIDLKLKKGSFTALVGSSGGGKSTVAKLVARFWDVTQGQIMIGGVNIKDMPLSQISENISFVSQDNFLFRCSLLENIRLGNPKATDEEVKMAARAAQCEEFILKIPNGYDTLAGEAGGRLSGGEKQRIAIARMMLKNAPVVILDEATAFTDPENEDKLQQSIAALTKGKTLLVIAHRLSTICRADNIVVLENGRIMANGKQEELLAGCPLYADMWKAHIGAGKWAVSTARKEEA